MTTTAHRPAHLNFKLGAPQTPAEHDPMHRDWVGWEATTSHQGLYERNRGLWNLGRAAQRAQLATFSHEGSVRVVIAVTDVETIASLEPGGRAKKAIIGDVLAPGDAAYDQLIGATVDAHRNPVTYIAATGAGPALCACGCGSPTAGGRDFVPGHDQRAIHERITRRWGSTIGFITWFDQSEDHAA